MEINIGHYFRFFVLIDYKNKNIIFQIKTIIKQVILKNKKKIINNFYVIKIKTYKMIILLAKILYFSRITLLLF
jgi:hypothetical protein